MTGLQFRPVDKRGSIGSINPPPISRNEKMLHKDILPKGDHQMFYEREMHEQCISGQDLPQTSLATNSAPQAPIDFTGELTVLPGPYRPH